MSSMDGQMEMGGSYHLSEADLPVAPKPIEHFSSTSVPVCAQCRGSLRGTARYGRIIRRALLDESTKKFILWSKREFAELYDRFASTRLELTTTSATQQLNLRPPMTSDVWGGSVMDQVSHVRGWLRRAQGSRLRDKSCWRRYQQLLSLLGDVHDFLGKVQRDEQPFQRVWHLCQNVSRRQGTTNHFSVNSAALQTGEYLRAGILELQCHQLLVADIETTLDSDLSASSLCWNFDQSVDLAKSYLDAAIAATIWATATEARLCLAKYAVLQARRTGKDGSSVLLRDKALQHVRAARGLCRTYPGSTRGLSSEVEDTERMINEGVFYSSVSMDERIAVVRALAREFSGSGHWYNCANGHPFTIGECGMPMEEARCPECAAPVGGRHHQAVAGVALAEDLDQLLHVS